MVQAQPASLQSGLVCHYAMDGDGSDQSPNGISANLIGGVSNTADRFGNPCGALLFDGATGYLSAPYHAALNGIQREFAVSVWARLDGASPDGLYWLTIVCHSDQANETDPNPHFRFQATSRTVSINTDFTENVDLIFDSGKWAHFVLNYNGTTVKMYHNTREVFTWAYSKTLTTNTQPLEIGRDVPGKTDFFPGAMDDLRIYNRALTQAEILALYQEKPAQTGLSGLEMESLPDLVLPAESGTCQRVVDFTTPQAQDPCASATVTQIRGLPSGSAFPVGNSSVKFKAVSSRGDIAMSSFRITIQDQEAPQVNCPADIQVQAAPGQNSTPVTYPPATATDNCGQVAALLSGGLPSGSSFPAGPTQILFTATDASGNQGQCTFTITVQTSAKPEILTLTCPPDVVTATDARRCDAVVKYAAPQLNGPRNAQLEMVSGLKSGQKFPSGETQMVFSATSPDGQKANCSFSVKVEDREAPLVNCPKDIEMETENGLQASPVDYAATTATDNCGPITPQRTSGLASGAAFPLGTSKVVYAATDAAGNKGECTFTVTLKARQKQESLTMTCPDNLVLPTDPGRCDRVVDYPEPDLRAPSGTSLARITGLPSGVAFPGGITNLQFLATTPDGKTVECAFTITIRDQEPPLVTCPEDQVVTARSEENEAVVNYPQALASDNCETTGPQLKEGLPTGSAFPVGKTKVEFVALDAGGNSGKCSFKVEVKPAPKAATLDLKCPENITVNADPGRCDKVVLFANPEIDGPQGSKLTSLNALVSGDQFPVGETTLVFEATAPDERKYNCNFRITVLDAEPPRLTCPEDVSVQVDYGSDGGKVDYPAPDAADNCSTPLVKMTAGKDSGNQFPLGQTTVKFVATDASNNQAECSFRVMVSGLPEKIDGEKVTYKEIVEIPTGMCTLYYYDDVENDGDVVSINVDGVWRVEKARIRNKTKNLSNTDHIEVALEEGKLHFVAFKAIDEGKVPTCTMKIAIYDERHKLIKVLEVHSSADESGAIILKRK